MPVNPVNLPFRGIAYRIVEEDILNGFNKVQKDNQPYILDLVTLGRIFFQNIPQTLEYGPTSQWVAIEVPGRNNPLYQFTGSEDILEFTLTWYSDDESRADVIMKCKWLESLTKADGFDSHPHPVQFAFGDLFSDATWIVESAKYTMGRFNREFAMLPCWAEQKMVLKRITDTNRRRTNILKYNT